MFTENTVVNIHGRRENELLKNTVDKDIQSMLLPLNSSQIMFLQFKYLIKNNRIRSNTLLTTSLSICGVLLFVMLHSYGAYTLYSSGNAKFVYLRYVILFESGLNCSAYFGYFIANLINAKSNKEFVLTIQEVHRFIKEKRTSTAFLIGNWISVILIYFVYLLVIISGNTLVEGMDYDKPLRIFSTAFLDTNIIYAIRLIIILKNKVILWNDRLLKMFKVYAQISHCYQLYKFCFRYVVSFIFLPTQKIITAFS